MLRDGELCACRIIEVLGVAASTVSAHMAVLQRAGLVEVRKDGKWRHYRLPGREAPLLVRKAMALLKGSLADEPSAIQDRERIRELFAGLTGCTV